MSTLDFGIVIAYLAALTLVGFMKRHSGEVRAGDFIVGGRVTSLPAFVATLVATWYGGILGVGEFSYQYGLSNWFVFGLPYYIAAFLFAFLLAKKARESELISIPDRLTQAYGEKAALVGSFMVFIVAVPASYVLMIGVLFQILFGWSLVVGVLVGSLFSVIYLYSGGFRSVVRTDILHFSLMFAGFITLFAVLYFSYGGWDFIASHVPAQSLTWHGGNSFWYIAIWYIIALQTLIDPGFFQRCYAAKTPAVAKWGIIVSVACWVLFDFLTTSCGIYARAILPNLADPSTSYPALAAKVLPVGLIGLFAVALLATVISTLESYAFLAGATVGNDIMPRLTTVKPGQVTFYTRIGITLSLFISIALALFFQSVVNIWHALGSIATPTLLVPVLTTFVGRRRMPERWAIVSMTGSGVVSLVWYLSKYFSADGDYWLGLEPILPGILLSVILYAVSGRRNV
ncbi:MAG: sodium:solute symporter family protein [candidate division Zixibacteria bacterium]|nr:sodium:solute symporter family protein [candidate division Zixibacteria bacterium]